VVLNVRFTEGRPLQVGAMRVAEDPRPLQGCCINCSLNFILLHKVVIISIAINFNSHVGVGGPLRPVAYNQHNTIHKTRKFKTPPKFILIAPPKSTFKLLSNYLYYHSNTDKV